MRKTKKFVCGAFACAMMLPMFTGAVFAATQDGSTDVHYDNTNGIPDPEHPDNPEWAVKIPSSIIFTDTNKKIDAGIELVSKNGGSLPTDDVTVTVASSNNYNLELNGADAVSYTLLYGGVTMTSAVNEVGKVNATKKIIAGEAIMTGTATKTGDHTDTLTYTIEKL